MRPLTCRRFPLHLLLSVVSSLLMGMTALMAQRQREHYLDCVVQWNDSSLVLSNSRISRNFARKQGQLFTQSITDNQRGQVWPVGNTLPDEHYPGLTARPATSTVQVLTQPTSNLTPAYLRVTVTTQYPGLAVQRVFRLYPSCPAIAGDLYYRGTLKASWTTEATSPGDRHRNCGTPAVSGDGADSAAGSALTVYERAVYRRYRCSQHAGAAKPDPGLSGARPAGGKPALR